MNFSNILNLKNILFGLGIFATVIALLGFSGKLPGFTDTSSQNQFSGNVNIWGTLPQENIQPVLELYNKNIAKTYNVIYKEVSEANLNQKLIESLADGKSPDLILAPYNTILSNENRLTSISNSVISETDYRNTFVDESSILVSNGGYLGFPISVDPLVLYFNRDILSTSGVASAPSTWEEFFATEQKITKFNQNNIPYISTIAFGTYDNIPHITDIVMAIIMQLGESNPIQKSYGTDINGNLVSQYKVNINDSANSMPLNTVLAFMKNFSDTQKETYTWNSYLPNALSQFISGNLAFYIGYASEAQYIKSSNQKLYFDYTYFPQISGSKVSTTYGKMYALSLLKTSPNSQAAYSTMLNLATGEYSQSLTSSTGGVSPLRAILSSPSGDQASIIFGRSALIAKGFQDIHRNQLEILMKSAIDSVNSGYRSTVEAANILQDSLQEIFNNN